MRVQPYGAWQNEVLIRSCKPTGVFLWNGGIPESRLRAYGKDDNLAPMLSSYIDTVLLHWDGGRPVHPRVQNEATAPPTPPIAPIWKAGPLNQPLFSISCPL